MKVKSWDEFKDSPRRPFLSDPNWCINCDQGPLYKSVLVKSDHQDRYLYFIYCKSCGFQWLRKMGMTRGGRVRRWEVTEGEYNKWSLARINHNNGKVYLDKRLPPKKHKHRKELPVRAVQAP